MMNLKRSEKQQAYALCQITVSFFSPTFERHFQLQTVQAGKGHVVKSSHFATGKRGKQVHYRMMQGHIGTLVKVT